MSKTNASSNFALGLVSSLVAAVFLAALWGYISYLTNYQNGWMAICVGYAIGMLVHYTGKGSSLRFGLLGASLSLFTCIIGNLLAGCLLISSMHSMPPVEVLCALDFKGALSVLTDTLDTTDLVFYAIAIALGYKLSREPGPIAANA